MRIKKYIIAIVLFIAIAGAGIFALVPQTARAQSAAVSVTNLTIEQLQQMVLNLQKMIAQIAQLIAQMHQQPSAVVCGNGKCETGETNDSCPKDCMPTCAQRCNNLGYAKGNCSGLNQVKNLVGFQPDGHADVNVSFDGGPNLANCQSGMQCVCTALSPTFCAKEGEQFTEDEYKLCCAGLETVAKIDGTYVCRKTDRTCADNLEMVYNDLMGPMTCCDPSAGIAPAENTGDAGEIRGFCVKDWDKTCGNGICDPLEHYYNCPWDCKPEIGWTCSVACLGLVPSPGPSQPGYSGGRCLGGTTNSMPQCAKGEFPFTYGNGQAPDFSDCNLFGQPKNISKTCCCISNKQ